MGKGELRGPPRREGAGFTLLEVMITAAVLVVALTALLQSAALAWSHHRLAQQRWKSVVALWNRVERLRADPPRAGGLHGELVLRVELPERAEPGTPRWEVLHAP